MNIFIYFVISINKESFLPGRLYLMMEMEDTEYLHEVSTWSGPIFCHTSQSFLPCSFLFLNVSMVNKVLSISLFVIVKQCCRKGVPKRGPTNVTMRLSLPRTFQEFGFYHQTRQTNRQVDWILNLTGYSVTKKSGFDSLFHWKLFYR